MEQTRGQGTTVSGVINDVDMLTGVIPVSKAASSLAQLITQTQGTRTPVVITQRGYPAAVLVGVAEFTILCDYAREWAAQQHPQD
jgi:prevent-host-death family protein